MKKKIFIIIICFFAACAILSTLLYYKSDASKKEVSTELFPKPIKSKIPGYKTISESRIFSVYADIEKLIYFNDRLYAKAKSWDMIQGDLIIHEELTKLIDSGYVPNKHGETNAEEFIGGYVLRASESDLVLRINNKFEYFIVISKY